MLTTATRSKAPPSRALGNLVRVLLGGILIAAAILKCYGARRGQVSEPALLRSIYAQVALVEAELILGAWLISGIAPRISHVAALLAFSCFLIAACYEVTLRARSCGCFGPVPMDPRLTAILDTAALIVLLSCRQACQLSGEIPRAVRGFTVLVGCAVALAAPAFMYRPPDTRRVIFLEPDRWQGNEFPVLRYINDGGELREGNWLVMLYRHDCPTCEAAMPAYLELAKRVSHRRKAATRIAFVELPPYESNPAHTPDAHWFALANSKEWAGATPIVVLLGDGIVKTAVQGEAALSPPAQAEQWIQ